MVINDKVSTLITFGYLSTTTCGMAFGLLCITIASFVHMLSKLLVRDVWTRTGSEGWGGCSINAQSRRKYEKGIHSMLHIFHPSAALFPCQLIPAHVALLPVQGGYHHQYNPGCLPVDIHQERMGDL